MKKNTAVDLLSMARALHERGWLAAADGNLSCRVGKNEILITPKARPKAFLRSSDLVKVKLEGKIPVHASSEIRMHLEVYRRCPKARAVIHAHPPMAVAWTIGCPQLKQLPAECISEVILSVGSIPIVPYARPSSQAMGDVLAPYLPAHRAMILSRHGALCWGEELLEAYMGIERLEHSATVLYYAQTLGGLSPLPNEEVEHLRKMRKELGECIL